MLIKLCLSLWSKFSSAYEELRNSNILVLPSSRTLRDYKSFLQPQTSFRNNILNDRTGLTSNFIHNQTYIAVLIDKMVLIDKIAFDKHIQELNAFVDLENPDKNFASVDPEDENLASHALVLYLRGICTDLKYCLAYFITRGVTSMQLFPVFWEEVSLLEMTCNLWVVGVASDSIYFSKN